MTANNNKWANIFNNPDFYPTPESVLIQMNLNLKDSIILEPQAGKGDIIEYCKLHGAKEVLFCEINEDLATISKEKGRFLKHDFLDVTAEEISHINQIVMNPPFSTSKKHLLHAWNIAPEGCEITSLFNTNTFNDLRYDRNELHTIIRDYGHTQDIGEAFTTAERKTNVKVSVIKLYKPITNNNAGFEGFYMDEEPETLAGEGIMQYNEVQALVNGYIGAAKCFDEFKLINNKMTNICAPVGMGGGFSYQIEYNNQTASKEEFLKALQKNSWRHIFSKMKLNKYLTSGVMEDINKFVETQTQVPFTVKNIYRMFEIIVGTKQNSFNRALEEAVDSFTKHTHENRFGVEGWKTNSGYMLNKKFIIDYMVETKFNGGIGVRIGRRDEQLNDLLKVLCNITGSNYDKLERLDRLFYKVKVRDENGIVIDYSSDYSNSIQNTIRNLQAKGKKYTLENELKTFNTWYDFNFFEVKGFKKGTLHIKFKDEKVWEQLNIAYAKIKGQVLPETTFKSNEPKQPENKTARQPKAEKTTNVSNEVVKATNQQLLSNLFN